MTEHVARLYALSIAVLGFFVAWAVVAAHPWKSASPAPVRPEIARLASIQQRLERDAALAELLVRARNGRVASARALASARVAARVVELPPITVTRTS